MTQIVANDSHIQRNRMRVKQCLQSTLLKYYDPKEKSRCKWTCNAWIAKNQRNISYKCTKNSIQGNNILWIRLLQVSCQNKVSKYRRLEPTKSFGWQHIYEIHRFFSVRSPSHSYETHIQLTVHRDKTLVSCQLFCLTVNNVKMWMQPESTM